MNSEGSSVKKYFNKIGVYFFWDGTHYPFGKFLWVFLGRCPNVWGPHNKCDLFLEVFSKMASTIIFALIIFTKILISIYILIIYTFLYNSHFAKYFLEMDIN